MAFKFAIVALIFIVCDCVTGIFKALKSGEFSSTGLKVGGFNKTGEILIIVLAYLIDYSLPIIGISIGITLVPIICSYITVMEIASNYENLCEICPALRNSAFTKYFGKIKSLNEDEMEDNNGTT